MHHHGGHFQIGTANGLFPCLLVLIGPVEYLVLHKLARSKGAERCAAEIEIMPACNGHIVIIPSAAALHVDTTFAHHLVLFHLSSLGIGIAQVEQTLGVVVPCPEVVLVQYD